MPLPAIVPLLAGVAGQAANIASGVATNKQAAHHARQMYIWQRTDALSDWQLQNEYNHPSSQMKRLREAGLNPNLVYGKGADAQAGAIRSSSAQSYNPKAPTFSASDAFAPYFDAQIRQAQVDNLRVQNTVAQEEAKLKQAQTFETTARTAKTALETTRGQFEYGRDQELRKTYIDAANANLEKLLADIDARRTETKISLSRNDREAMQNAQTIAESAQRIIASRIDNLEKFSRMETNRVTRDKMREEILNLQEMRKNIATDGRIKSADAELKERGQQPTDPAWQRWLGNFLEHGGISDQEIDDIMSRHGVKKKR